MAMMRPGSARTLLSFLVVLVVLGVERSEATIYQVGNATGWGIPSTTDFYEKWTEGVEFKIGDQLIFTWSGNHDVATVTESQYDNCTTTVAANNISTTSPVTVNLTTTGDHYYICTISNHCSRGQKLKIDVTSASTTPTSSVSPPPPPPPSASPSSGPIVALSATLSVLAFVFFLC